MVTRSKPYKMTGLLKVIRNSVPKITDPLPLNIVVHVIILFTILSLFFFLYISTIMKNAFKGEFDHLGRELAEKLKDAPPKVKQAIATLPLEKAAVLYSVPDPVNEMNNKWLQRVPIILFAAMMLVLITSYLACDYCYDFKSLWVHNIIIFAFIAVIEFGFFYFIASKFIPVAPSVLVTAAIDRIKTKIIA